MSVNFDGTAGADFDLGDITAARFDETLLWTFLAFIRVVNTASDQRAIINKWGATAIRQVLIRVGSGTAPQDIGVHHNNVNPVNGSAGIELDTWYLVAVSSNGSGTVTLNVLNMDGTFVDNALTGTLTGNKTMTAPIRVGAREASNDPFNGDMAYVAYLQRELAQSEVVEYLHNPAKVVHRVGGATGPVFFLPMKNLATTPDWSGQGNVGTRNASGHTDGDNPPIASLYAGFSGWQGQAAVAVAAAVETPGIHAIHRRRRMAPRLAR